MKNTNTKKVQRQSNRITDAIKRWPDIFLVSSLLVLILNVGYLQHFIGGVVCGKSPLIVDVGTSFAGGSGTSTYSIPDDGPYYYQPSLTSIYYCSSIAADSDYIQPAYKGYGDYSDVLTVCPSWQKKLIAAYETSTQEGYKYHYITTDKELTAADNESIVYFCTAEQAENNGYGSLALRNLHR